MKKVNLNCCFFFLTLNESGHFLPCLLATCCSRSHLALILSPHWFILVKHFPGFSEPYHACPFLLITLMLVAPSRFLQHLPHLLSDYLTSQASLSLSVSLHTYLYLLIVLYLREQKPKKAGRLTHSLLFLKH